MKSVKVGKGAPFMKVITTDLIPINSIIVIVFSTTMI